MKKYNIIMLDIDGVVCTQDCWKQREVSDKHHKFNRRCLDLLEYIVKETDARIVITSTWRMGLDVQQLRDVFKERKFLYYKRIIGVTAILDSSIRGLEIDDWLRIYHHKNYVILDDDSDMLYMQRNNFIKTDCYKGLNKRHANKAIKILLNN